MAAEVTVLLTPRDQRERVTQALERVRAQTVSSHLVLVADDGSSDGTEQAVREQFGGDPRLRVEACPAKGTAAVRNHALGSIETPWTALLEVGDHWSATYLESQLEALATDPEADVVVAGCRYVGETAGLYSTSFDRPDWRTPNSIENLCGGAFVHPSAVVVRTRVARELPFDEALETASVLDWLFRAVGAGHRVVENRHTLLDYHARDAEDPALVALEADEVRMRYADRCDACRQDPLDLIRRRARYLRRVGRKREARRFYWRWWKKKPDSTQALGGLLRCLFARK